MPPATVYFDLADTSDEAFDRPIEWMLVALLAFGPLSMGAVHAWSETIVCGLALAMGVTLAVKLLRRPDVPFVRSWTYWPIALFIAVVGLQVVPLPAGVVKVISPHTWTLRHELLGELDGAAGKLKWMTLSFYPEQTLRQLKLLVAVAIVFVVVVNCVRRVSQIRWLMGAIAVIGATFALLALAQIVTGADSIYWLVPNSAGYSVRGGPFANRNHFGQFMNLCIGAAGGLVLVLMNQHFRRDNYTPDEVRAKLRSEAFRPAWLLMLMIVLGLGAVCLSLSRGAMLSTAVAGAVMGVVLVTRRGAHGHGWIIFVLVLCVAMIGLASYGSIARRLTEMSGDTWAGHRLELLRDSAVAWKQFPALGVGLGTHALVFPMYDRSDLPYLATHAENEYAQVMTETGAAGVVLVLAFIAVVLATLVRAVRGPLSPASSAAIGLGYGLLAILIQSATDFGQHAPANAALTAVTCGLLLNLAQLRGRELESLSPALPQRGRLWARLLAVVAVVALSAALMWDGVKAWRAEDAWSVVKRIDASLARKDWIAENPEYVDVIQAAERASRLRPRNVEYHYGLNFYRWKSIARLRDEQTGGLVLPPPLPDHAARVVQELHQGRWLAPTHAATYVLAGQIERSVLNQPQVGRGHIERGVTLGGADPMAAFIAGEAAALDGDVEASLRHLRRAAQLSPNLRVDVADVYFQRLKRPDLAMEVAQDDLESLSMLAMRLEKLKTPEAVALGERAQARAFEVLARRAEDDDASANVLAQMAEALVRREQYEQAIPFYLRALRIEFAQTEWRIALARAYEKTGQDAHAMREAEACLRRRPQMPEALEMIARLKKKAEAAAATKATKPARGR